MAKLPTVALVGRTNVGKSTLFNRLSETRKALVSKVPGTTRDRKEAECIWRGLAIKVIDTGGLDVDRSDEIENNTIKQAELGMAQADILLFVVDLNNDPLPQEIELAKKLSKSKKPIMVVGNKAESDAARQSAKTNVWRLPGMKAPIAISALRGTGVGDLLDEIYDQLKKLKLSPQPLSTIKPVKVGVIGKPNVGKSSLLNTILKEERFIATNIAHTTREPNDVLLEVGDRQYLFIDTAGMRKKGKVRKSGGLEAEGVDRTRKMIKEADVTLLVIDISEPLGSQDRKLAGELKDSRAGVIIVANKWDLIKDKTPTTINRFKKIIQAEIPFLAWAPIAFVSAKTGQRADELVDLIDEVQSSRHKKVEDKDLDVFLKKSIKHHSPKRGKGPKPPQILGIKQINVAPPTFELFVKAKRKDVLHPSWVKYLENSLHREFELTGTPVRIQIKLPRARAK